MLCAQLRIMLYPYCNKQANNCGAPFLLDLNVDLFRFRSLSSEKLVSIFSVDWIPFNKNKIILLRRKKLPLKTFP
jgi:hypothetical protein